MPKKDVIDRADIIDIIARFYDVMLKDSIIGFIFTDVIKIELESHLPIIVNFWCDALFRTPLSGANLSGVSSDAHEGREGYRYRGNTLQKHLDINQQLSLKPGHFTRWLYLFDKAVDEHHSGLNADAMKKRAEMVAKSISAAIDKQKRGDVNLALNSKLEKK